MMVNVGDLTSSRIVYLTDVNRPRIVLGDWLNLEGQVTCRGVRKYQGVNKLVGQFTWFGQTERSRIKIK
jgi:hypothetical protein